MRKYATTLILWATLLLNELHTLWAGSTRYVMIEGQKVSAQWYVWLASDSVFTILLLLAAFVFYQPNRVNIAVVRAYIAFACCDLLMFFINFRQHDYGVVYTVAFAAPFFFYGQYDKLIYWIKNYRNGTANRKGNTRSVEC
jgi:hypothetical protein